MTSSSKILIYLLFYDIHIFKRLLYCSIFEMTLCHLLMFIVFLNRREKTTKEMEIEVSHAPKLDLGFKDGQTIKINLAGVSSVS